MDGTYGVTISGAEVASGDCVTCGNDGQFTLIVHKGRYALLHPLLPNADPA